MLMQHRVEFKANYTPGQVLEPFRRDIGSFSLKVAAAGDDWVLCENWVLGEERDDELLLVQAVRVGATDSYTMVVAVGPDATWAPRVCKEVSAYVRGLRKW